MPLFFHEGGMPVWIEMQLQTFFGKQQPGSDEDDGKKEL